MVLGRVAAESKSTERVRISRIGIAFGDELHCTHYPTC